MFKTPIQRRLKNAQRAAVSDCFRRCTDSVEVLILSKIIQTQFKLDTASAGQRHFRERQGTFFTLKHKKISSPSPREFGPKDAAIESSVDRIHEERGLGGEE